MSGRLASESPSPPKSRSSSNKRRPLHIRTDSEINEATRRLAISRSSVEQENLGGEPLTRFAADKIHSTSPFPTLDSQILRPHPSDRNLDFLSVSSNSDRALEIQTSTPFGQRTPSATTDIDNRRHSVILDRTSTSRTHDSQLQPVSVRSSSSFSSTPRRAQSIPPEPALVTPASTIRLVDNDTPSTSAGSGRAVGALASELFSRDPSAYDFRHFGAASSDAPDWPLPALPATSTEPVTPTPASRAPRPMPRSIVNLASDGIQTSTPDSVRSANSNGTLIHRRGFDDPDDLPTGSYLHYADRRPRSSSNANLLSSSPNIRSYNQSSPLVDSPIDRAVRSSPRRDSDSFPALRRYLRAAEAVDQPPNLPSEPSSPAREASSDQSTSWQPVRSHAQRWGSLMSLSTIPSVPEGTTAPSSIRIVSTEPSNLFDEETSGLTADTVQSSIRVVTAEQSRGATVEVAEMSILSQDTAPRSSIRLVSPESSYLHDDADVSALSFMTESSIRVVENSPVLSDDASRYSQSTFQETPIANRTPRQTRFRNSDLYSSPAWVSYSSPVQLPHIVQELDGDQNSDASSNRSQLSLSGSIPSITHSPLALGVAVPPESPRITRMPYRRRSIRQTSQTSPFFHGSSGRANLRQSTIGQEDGQGDYRQVLSEAHQTHVAISDRNQRHLKPFGEPGSSPPISPILQDLDGLAASSSHDVSPLPQQMVFPAASSSINNTPRSIHIPRNRPLDRSSRAQHIRARTLGSSGTIGMSGVSDGPTKSPRRSSSPVMPYNHPMPATPSDCPPRPSNPTPGVTPGVTPAQDRRVRHVYQPTLPDINPMSDAEPISYPSIVHHSSHYQLPGRVGHRDFSPHLWHGAAQAVNRRSTFRPPSVDEFQVRFMAGAKARRDLQIACFALGFLLPICWFAASFVPLPGRGNVDLIPATTGRNWKGKSVIGDLEKVEGYDVFTADEVAGYESARWWRGMNRCLSTLGVVVMTVLIVLGVVTSKGGIQA